MSVRTALVFVLVLGSAAATARAFTLGNFPSQAEIDAGLVNRWVDYVNNPGQPFVLTYAVDPDFLAGEDPETVANAMQAIQGALQSWTDATHGMIQFEQADWSAFRNGTDYDGDGQPDSSPPSQFVGPPLMEWIACAGSCDPPFDPDCIAMNCPSPGWGAHIDFFSEPTGYSVCFGGTSYRMQSCNLGFTGLFREGSDRITSADIYINSDWDWTTDEQLADPSRAAIQGGANTSNSATHDGIALDYDAGCSWESLRAACDPPPLVGDCTTEHGQYVIDLQTVLVHEIGHALGLDHPDEAASNGSPNLSPWTFAPGQSVNPFAVMYSDYIGVKRNLIADDIGGMAFLYPPALYGDINADGSIGFVDAFAALDIFEGRVSPDPWIVNRLDYNLRNGEIDMDELQQLLLWVVDPINFPPGQVPGENPALWESGVPRASSITIDGMTVPYDIGVGGVVDLTLTIDNPQQADVQGWDLRIQYNSDVLLNPRYGQDRDFLTGSSLIPMTITEISPGLSELRIGSLGFDIDNSASGMLVTVEFDVDLIAATAVSHVDFIFNEATSEIVVATPYTHVYSMDPNFPDENLTYVPISADAYLLDIDASNFVDINDLYAYTAGPVDVNYDTFVDEIDRATLIYILRQHEVDDVANQFETGGSIPPSFRGPTPVQHAAERREVGN